MNLRFAALSSTFAFLALTGCSGPDTTEMGSLGVGDTLLEQAVSVPKLTGGPQAGTVETVTFDLAQATAALVYMNHATLDELKRINGVTMLTTTAANNAITARPLATIQAIGLVSGIGPATLRKIRQQAPAWSRLGEFPAPEGVPGEQVFQLQTAQSFTARLEQDGDNAAQLRVTIGEGTLESERATDPTLEVPVPAGETSTVLITVRNFGRSQLTGTLRVEASSGAVEPRFEVLFTNPLCNDVSVQGAKPGARCTGSEKNASRAQALSYATGTPTIVEGGVVGRIVSMFEAARAYKTAHPEADVRIYQSYLSFYVDAGLKTALVAAIDAGVSYIGYFDSNGDVAIPLELEAMGRPNIHIGWLGGHTDINGTWRLMHNKFTMVDFGVESEPMLIVASSANLSPSGTSIHFENYLFASVPRSSNFAERHLCAIEAAEADKYPSRTATSEHVVVFEEEYDRCVEELTSEEDPRFHVFFTPDVDAEALELLKDRMRAATTRVDMAIEHFSEWSLARALRDVPWTNNRTARIVLDDQTLYMDGESSEGDNLMWHAVIKNSRIQQRFLRTNANMNPGFQLMHNKYVVMDGTSVFMGAGNFTSAGFRRNYENFYFFDLPELAAQYQMHFEHLFNDLGSQLNEIPEPVEQ